MWRMARQQSEWQVARVTLHPNSQTIVQIEFEALYGGNTGVILYLDNVMVSDGDCTLTGNIYDNML